MKLRCDGIGAGGFGVGGAGRKAGQPIGNRGRASRRQVRTWSRRPGVSGGNWIEITYGRPIKRGRDSFGAPGPKYGKVANPDAPVWRAGANNSTQLKTEVPLMINGKAVAPGTYTMFIDLKPNNWTLIVSNWKAQTALRPEQQGGTLGRLRIHAGQGRGPGADDAGSNPMSVEQLTWSFSDMSDAGGKLAIIWGKQSHRSRSRSVIESSLKCQLQVQGAVVKSEPGTGAR